MLHNLSSCVFLSSDRVYVCESNRTRCQAPWEVTVTRLGLTERRLATAQETGPTNTLMCSLSYHVK